MKNKKILIPIFALILAIFMVSCVLAAEANTGATTAANTGISGSAGGSTSATRAAGAQAGAASPPATTTPPAAPKIPVDLSRNIGTTGTPTTGALTSTTLAPLTNALGVFVNFIFVDVSKTIGDLLFTRVLLWILLFTVFYAVLMNFGSKGGKSPFAKKNTALPIAAIVALISVYFMPDAFVLSIGTSYGLAVSFLLMTIPVVAIIFLANSVFPTSETKEPDAGKRRINHGGKAVIYYFLSTLITNYMSVMSVKDVKLNVASFSTSWIEMSNLAIAALMVLFMYHLIMAIFTGGGGKYEYGEKEGWFESLLKGGEGAAQKPLDASKPKEGEKEPDLSQIIGKIGDFRKKVQNYDAAVTQFEQQAEAVRTADETKLAEEMDGFLQIGREMRRRAADADAAASSVSDMSDLFRKLKNEQIVHLVDIIRTYRNAHSRVIDAINHATS